MAEGAWWHTAQILAMLANIHREQGATVAQPQAFNPRCQKRKRTAAEIAADKEDARALFEKVTERQQQGNREQW